MSAHAKLSPSSAYRWGSLEPSESCPGSANLCASVVDAGSKYSDEGTAGHEVFAICADTKKSPLDFVGQKMSNAIEITEELAEHVVTAIEWVEAFRELHPGAAIFKEKKFEIGEGLGLPPGLLWGTADFVSMTTIELVVADLKLGYVDVDEVGNEQLILYGLGAMDATGWIYDRVRLVILQPKKNLGPKEIVYTAAEMQAFAAKLYQAAVEALKPDAPLRPSKLACQFCKAAGACPALKTEMIALVNRDFSSLATLTGAEIGELLSKAKMIEGAVKSIRAHALRLLEIEPDYVPGWKRVQGEKKRRYKDEKVAQSTLELLAIGGSEKIPVDDIAPRKLTTPLQVETKIAAMLHAQAKKEGKKLTKKKAMELAQETISYLVEKPEGEATLVPAEDKRTSLAPVFTEADLAQFAEKPVIEGQVIRVESELGGHPHDDNESDLAAKKKLAPEWKEVVASEPMFD